MSFGTGGHHGHDRMVVGFATTYAMSAYIVENSIKHHNPFGTVMNLEECEFLTESSSS
jgi:hypothetical protein